MVERLHISTDLSLTTQISHQVGECCTETMFPLNPKAPSGFSDHFLSVNNREPPDLLLHSTIQKLPWSMQERPAESSKGGRTHQWHTTPSFQQLSTVTFSTEQPLTSQDHSKSGHNSRHHLPSGRRRKAY